MGALGRALYARLGMLSIISRVLTQMEILLAQAVCCAAQMDYTLNLPIKTIRLLRTYKPKFAATAIPHAILAYWEIRVAALVACLDPI